MYLRQFFIEGLGHASYLIASDETKEAAVIDPRRDVEIYGEDARQNGLTIRYALETHNHNDFLSGARALAERYGAEHVASAAAELKPPHRGVREGDEIRLGELLVKVLFTPGHTPEHVTYVVLDLARAEVPVLAFTGGDLLVGTVGRPDLLGRELGEKLAPLLYDSLHGKILRLEDYVEVLPTHGAGSLCGRGITSKRTTTIGYERRFNPALQKKTKEEFVEFVLAGDPAIPTYYRRMRPANQHGVADWQLPEPRAMPPTEVQHLAGHGALVLDVRANTAFGGGHVPGAVNVGLEPSFATWVGWLLPPDAPIVLVLDDAAQWAKALTALARVGYERFAGYLLGGMAAWVSAGLPTEHLPQWSVQELRARLDADRAANLAPQVLDVRTDAEWQEAHIPGATHVPLDQLPERMAELHPDPDRPLAVLCGSGYRSSIASSLLRARGFPNVANVLGSMSAWKAVGYPVTREGDGSPGQLMPDNRPKEGKEAA
jgi:hydroxyacylglutathione hydrolase